MSKLFNAAMDKLFVPDPNTRQPPPALPRHEAAPPTSSTAAIPEKPAAAAAADLPAPEADVWQRGDKFARGVLHEDSNGQGTEASPKLARKAITLDAIVAEYRKSLRLTTHRHLFVGGLIHTWIRRQPERAEQLPRAAAIIVIEDRITAEGLSGVCRPHRDLKCFHAAKLLGGDADALAISAIYHILKLVDRDPASDTWHLLKGHEKATQALWARMLAERLTADEVRAEVDKILPPPALQRRMPHSRQAATVLRLLPHLSIEELHEVFRAVKAAKEAKASSSSPAIAAA